MPNCFKSFHNSLLSFFILGNSPIEITIWEIFIPYLCFKDKTDRKQIKKWYKIVSDGSHPNFSTLQYHIVYDKNQPIGVTGIYSLIDKPKEMWLGWFGIVPKARRRGLGSKVTLKTMALAKTLHGKIFRLYGSSNKAAKFYEKLGFKRQIKPDKWIIIDNKKVYKYEQNTFFYFKRL